MKLGLKHRSIVFGLMISLVFPMLAVAQGERNETGEIEEAEIVIRKDRKITLPGAIRNFEKIPQLPIRKAVSEQSYQFKNYSFQLKSLSPSFRPVGFRANEKQKTITGNYVKAGYGNYSTPYVEAHLGSLRSRDYVYNTYIRHLSSKTGPVFGENSGNSDTEVTVGGKYFNALNTVSGSLNYVSSNTHFYGYNPVLDLQAADIERKFSKFSTKLGVEKTNKNEIGTYRFITDWSFFRDNLNARENQFAFDLGLGYKPNDLLKLSLQGIAILSKREDTNTSNRSYFNIRPRATYTGDIFTLTVGANIADDNDDLPGAFDSDESLNVFPYARVWVKASSNISLYAQYDGDLEMNSFQKFAQEMPFIEADFTLFNTEKSSDLMVGTEVDLTKGVRINGGFSLASYKRLSFFTNSITDSTRFEVLYENTDTDVVNVFSELIFEKPNEIRSSLRFDYYDYQLPTFSNPFHRPQFKLTAHATAFPMDKLKVSADLYYLGGLYGLNRETNVESELDGIFDLNLLGNYDLSSQFGVFLQVNNVFGKEYERFLNYANRGIQFLAGISISF